LTVSSNEQTVAYGQLREETSYKNIRAELIFSLVCNNMGADSAGSYHSYTNNIGDFILVQNKLLPTGEITTNDFSVVHFVRGFKAVSLHGKDGLDVRPIAETLDALLKNPPASQ